MSNKLTRELKTILGRPFTCSAILFAVLVLPFSAHAARPAKATARAAMPEKLPALTSAASMEQLEVPMTAMREKSSLYARDKKQLSSQSLDDLEGLANEAILARVIKSVYTDAMKQNWAQTQSFRIFPLEHLLSNSALETPVAFNPNGFRVAVFALRLGRTQRGVLLTSSFQSINPGELRELYKHGSLISMIDNADADFDIYGAGLVERFRSGDSKKSRHMPVTGNASTWVVGCESTLAGRFCVNASLFDSTDTDPSLFVDALIGAQDSSDLVSTIRSQNLAWPIDKTFISRGYKTCGCTAKHFGLDLTAPIGTPVRSVANGVVLHAKQFSGWGTTVVIEHTLPSGQKYISVYGHLSKFRKGLKPGMSIVREEIIAQTGNSGASHGPHLHLEIRNAPEGREPLEQPRTAADRPLDPLRVLDIFNVFVGGENISPQFRR
ncbi:hypothetical protein BH10BDE1_BH10BDE1_02830 [soil metagenome]